MSRKAAGASAPGKTDPGNGGSGDLVFGLAVCVLASGIVIHPFLARTLHPSVPVRRWLRCGGHFHASGCLRTGLYVFFTYQSFWCNAIEILHCTKRKVPRRDA